LYAALGDWRNQAIELARLASTLLAAEQQENDDPPQPRSDAGLQADPELPPQSFAVVDEAIELYRLALAAARQASLASPLDSPSADTTALQGNLLAALADLHARRGDAAAISAYQQAVDLAHQSGDQPAEAVRLHNLGLALLRHGDRAAARQALSESLAIKQALLPAGHPTIQRTEEVIRGLGV
jgi:tetratricopeptide (TPR) repeat protein